MVDYESNRGYDAVDLALEGFPLSQRSTFIFRDMHEDTTPPYENDMRQPVSRRVKLPLHGLGIPQASPFSDHLVEVE